MPPNGCRNTAIFEHASHAAHRIGSAAEAEQVDAIARLPNADDRCVAVNDVLRDAETGCAGQPIVEPAPPLDLDALALAPRSEAAVVECNLRSWVNGRIRTKRGWLERACRRYCASRRACSRRPGQCRPRRSECSSPPAPPEGLLPGQSIGRTLRVGDGGRKRRWLARPQHRWSNQDRPRPLLAAQLGRRPPLRDDCQALAGPMSMKFHSRPSPTPFGALAARQRPPRASHSCRFAVSCSTAAHENG